MLRWFKQKLSGGGTAVFHNIEAYNSALDRLMNGCSHDDCGIEDFARHAAEIAGETLGVERFSVWSYNQAREAIDCVDLFQRSTRSHSAGGELHRVDYPRYFEAILENRLVNAPDAKTDPRTAEFNESYLRPNGITSLLDAQIPSAAGPRGIVCAESVGERRRWTSAEAAFASSIAGLIGFAFDRLDRQKTKKELEDAVQRLVETERQFSDLAAHLPGALFQYVIHPDGSDEIGFMSLGCEQLWGVDLEDVGDDPSPLWELINSDDLPEMKASVEESAKSLTQWSHRWRITTPAGVEKWLHGRGTPERLANGGVRFSSFIVDVTDAVRQEQELEATRAELEANDLRRLNAIEALPDAFVIYDKDDQLVICNEQYRRTYAEVAELIVPGAQFEDIIRACAYRGMHPQAVGREEEWVAERMAAHLDPKGVIEQELPGDRHLQIHERKTDSGDIVGCRVNVTELKRQQRRLEEMADALRASKSRAEYDAMHDPLTELPNRRHLDQQLEAIELSAHENADVCLLHVDLDRFKQINDTLGHSAGDHVLKAASQLLRENVRAGDFVARIGGDEFVVLCHGVDDEDDSISAMADRIVEEMSKPIRFKDTECRLSASVGLARAKDVDARSLLVNADIALYQAKNNGRARVVPFTSELQKKLNAKKQTADEILSGLETDAFFPVYQPQFDAETHECIGVEALARWRHPERGVVAPFAFLDVAEDLNVIDQIDRMIMRKAIREVELLREEGVEIEKLAVNVSMPRLLDPVVYQDIVKLKPKNMRVAFELLETVYFDEAGADVSWAIDQLRGAGVEFEIDDFGSGRASVIGLLKINPNRLKIDRKLIGPISTCERTRRLVEAIAEMGRSQGIGVTAEGIEHVEHLEILREIGCDALQGYYFARPMPADELKAFLAKRAWPQAA